MKPSWEEIRKCCYCPKEAFIEVLTEIELGVYVCDQCLDRLEKGEIPSDFSKTDNIKTIDKRDIEYLKNLLSYEAELMYRARVNKKFFEYQSIKRWLNELDHIGRYKAALEKIINLRHEIEYIDEWQEAAAYNKAEEIAEKTLNPEREPGGLK